MFLPLIAVVSTLTTRPPPTETWPCQGETTQEVEDCLSKLSAKAEAKLQTYRAAAKARLQRDARKDPQDQGVSKALDEFDKAERAWEAYREAECGGVFDYWSGGTIRVSMDQVCQIRLTYLHTHTVWREWLTYLDSTPPLLPEPAVPATP